jgi:phosphate acetyltransferase
MAHVRFAVDRKGQLMNATAAETGTKSPTKYDRLIAAAKAIPPVLTIVVHPCDETSLRGAIESAQAGIIEPILVGPALKIKDAATKVGLDVAGFELSTRPTAKRRLPKASS